MSSVGIILVFISWPSLEIPESLENWSRPIPTPTVAVSERASVHLCALQIQILVENRVKHGCRAKRCDFDLPLPSSTSFAMNKTCARCQKVVYPIEELKCLDKVWHKACFKCRECGMTLNMRTYKGFEKQPYCEAHIPKAKATTMAETPELRRIAENTKIQSNAVYHAEFERAKGKCTQVADDPETLRIKKNTHIISNASYHGDQQKKAVMEQKRALEGEPQVPTPAAPPPMKQPPMKQPIGVEQRDSPYSARQSSTVIYTSDQGPVSSAPQRRVGSIADLDPLSREYGSMAPPPAPSASSGRVCRALYDYEAQDGDEVSFRDGDLLLDCSPVDEGWMTGVVERTGRSGMLPANYVQALH